MNQSPIERLIREVSAWLGETANGPVPREGEGSVCAPLTPERLASLPDRDLARFIDHTLLKPDASAAAVERLCAEALRYGFATVCVNPDHVERCVRLLAGSPVGVATVVGFPLGATTARLKALEAEEFVRLGATELDMVLNIGRLKDRDYVGVREDMAGVVRGASARVVKVIIEAGLLTDEEKIAACLLARSAGVDFVKTSTGITSTGATAEDVALMRLTVGAAVGVKAAGGVRDAASARAMLAAGANRLGTSSSIAIVSGD